MKEKKMETHMKKRITIYIDLILWVQKELIL